MALSTVRLLGMELRRLIVRPRFLLGVAPSFGWSAWCLWKWSFFAGGLHRAGAFTLLSEHWFAPLMVLCVGIVAATSLAEDLRDGAHWQLLVRGCTRARYVLVKAAAMGVAGGSIVPLAALGFFLMAWLYLPAGRTLINPDNHGPVPDLLRVAPGLNDLLLVGMLSFAAAALAQTGLLAGVLVQNEYFAAAAPLLAVVVGAFAAAHGGSSLDPASYVFLGNDYVSVVPAAMLPYAAFVYWGAFGGLLVLVSAVLFTRLESP